MSEVIPTEINLHKRSRVLSIGFSDGQSFDLPCEYLRVFSRAAEHLALKEPVVGKSDVNITKIEPQGSYALRLYFDDGHDTGIYSFETLYTLGENQAENWKAYRDRLRELGQLDDEPTDSGININVALIDWLGEVLDCDEETIQLPGAEHRVADVLALLRQRSDQWNELLKDDAVEVEIDYEEVDLDSPLEEWDELVIRPVASTPHSGY